MKTIKQIADEVGVSKQAVYKRIKGSLHTNIAPYIHTVDGTVYIEDQGETLINRAFLKDGVYKDAHTDIHTDIHTYAHTEHTGAHTKLNTEHTKNEEVAFLREQIKLFSEQLATKDKQLDDERSHSREQADKLSDLAAQLAELTRNNQVLLGAEQSRTNPAFLRDNGGVDRRENKSFLRRFFKKTED